MEVSRKVQKIGRQSCLVLLFLIMTVGNASGLEFETIRNPLSAGGPFDIGREADKPDGALSVDCTGEFSNFVSPPVAIKLMGKITKGDNELVRDHIETVKNTIARRPDLNTVENCPKFVILLDLTGGDLVTAIEIAQQILDENAPTVVLPNDSCTSACVHIFAAGSTGKKRTLGTVLFKGGVLGFHVPRGSEPFAQAKFYSKLLKSAPQQGLSKVIGDLQETWQISKTHFIERLQKPTYFDFLLASPASASDFSYIDTFEEARLLGIEMVFQMGQRPTNPAELKRSIAIRLCASSMIKSGELSSLLEHSSANYGSSFFIGFEKSGRFCFVTPIRGTYERDTAVCVFDANDLGSLAKFDRNTPIEPYIRATGGWWPHDLFARRDLMPSILQEAGKSFEEVEVFFRSLMLSQRNNATTPAFCDFVESEASSHFLTASQKFSIDTSCKNATKFCQLTDTDGAEHSPL